MDHPIDPSLDLNSHNPVPMERTTKIWNPTFSVGTRPITVRDSAMSHVQIAAGIARGLYTPRDQILLSRRGDEEIAQDALAFTARGVVAVSALQRRLLARSQEVANLCARVAELQSEANEARDSLDGTKRQNNEYRKLLHENSEILAAQAMELGRLRKQLKAHGNKVPGASTSAARE